MLVSLLLYVLGISIFIITAYSLRRISTLRVKRIAKLIYLHLRPNFQKKSTQVDFQFFLFNYLYRFLTFSVEFFLISFAVLKLKDVFPLFNSWAELLRISNPYFTVLVLLFVYDFSLYWIHRAYHSSYLWRFHVIHHYGRQMNIFTSRREHPFYFTSKGAAFVMIVVSLLINPVQDIHKIHGWSDYLSVNQHIFIVNLIVLFIVKIIPAINHSNIYLNYPGFLRYIFVSPVHHTIHHARNIPNKNFGGFLSLWDYLFGTFVNVPNKSFFKSVNKSLGVSNVGDQDISNIIDALVHPFKR